MPKYHLKPFDKLSSYEVTVDINCNLVENNLLLDLKYSVLGNIQNLQLEAPVLQPQRTEELWKKSCFEIFLNNNLEHDYVEFNFSSSKNWNSYIFDNYRVKNSYLQLPSFPKINTYTNDQTFTMNVSVEFNYKNFNKVNQLFISPTVILQHNNNAQSFWAIKHTKNHPDFHVKDSFFQYFPLN
ncbi:MAG: hypothetical protein U0T83_03915 [Bacteriovoracaceae bacterium]